MLLRWIIGCLSLKTRRSLADRLLPRKDGGEASEAGARLRKSRGDLSRLAMVGSLAGLVAMLGGASWEGSGIEASRALASSAQLVITAFALAAVSVALGVWEDYARGSLNYRRVVPDDGSDQEDHYYYDQAGDWHEDNAPTTIPRALRWYFADWGASVCLAGSVIAFTWGLFDAALRLAGVGK